jgi:hypothetical protein
VVTILDRPLECKYNDLSEIAVTFRAKGVATMQDTSSRIEGYLLAAFLGAAVGDVVALLVTRAIPGMMAGMMARIGGGGVRPGGDVTADDAGLQWGPVVSVALQTEIGYAVN